MTDFTKFNNALEALDKTVDRIAVDLVGAEDIKTSLLALAAYKLELPKLVKIVDALTAQKAQAVAHASAKSEALRKITDQVNAQQAKLKKLRDLLDHNIEAAKSEPGHVSVEPSPLAIQLGLPASRKERIGQIEAEIAEVEKAPVAIKNAKEALRRAVKRAKELGEKLAEAAAALTQAVRRLPEMTTLARKTATHLKNRQSKRDSKRAARTSIEVVEAPVQEAPAAPSDEDIRKWAADNGLLSENHDEDDLKIARELYTYN